MPVVLALAAAAIWGTADYLGGAISRNPERGAAFRVSFGAQLAGTAVMALALALESVPFPSLADIYPAALAGLGGGFAVLMLYRGLAVGRMGVVAPVAAVGSAALPVMFSIIGGEIPTALAWGGIAAGIIGISLVARVEPDEGDEVGVQNGRRLPPGVAHGLLAGAGFGSGFIFLDLTNDASGLWPLLPLKIAAIAVTGAAAIGWGGTLKLPEGTWRTVLVIGVLDTCAVLLYLLASREDLLAIVAVLVSLYPAATVLLARVRLGEQLTRVQLAGLMLSFVAIALIAGG